MPASPSLPGPDEPRPLSDRERRELAEVERHLVTSEPRLATAFTRVQRGGPGTSSRLDRILQAAAVGIVLFLVLPDEWRAALTIASVLVLATAAGLWMEPSGRVGRHGDDREQR
jgi:hypothetical protein